jgi:glycogen debranching enzyme
LTPLGIRTLAPGSPGYRGEYVGDQNSRDRAYHQGTAWPWLTGQFVSALVKVRGDSPEARAQGREILAPFATHLLQAGLGSISEIIDGDAPWRPRGCIAQAWSVGEILRSYWEDVLGKAPSWPHEQRAPLKNATAAAVSG